MMPHEPVLDIMRRTMTNLAFVERHAAENGLFEVAQLINSFLGALAHPWETLRDDLNQISIADAKQAGWPTPTTNPPTSEQPKTLGDFLRLLRNGIAHGNLQFRSDGRGEIAAIQIENFKRGIRTWGVTMTVRDMKTLLEKFVALVEEIEREARQPKRTA